MKKKIFGAALLAIAGLSLASCGGADEGLVVKFWHTMSKEKIQPVLNEAIAEFEELYPEVRIVHEQIGDYEAVRDQIKTNIATGNYPSMAYCYPDHVALYNEAMVTLQLDEYINDPEIGLGGSELLFDGPKKEDFVQSFYNEGKIYGDGKMYTMPFLKSTEALFYNKDFFDGHKLTVPTTWDEMWDVCAQIKEIDKNSTPLGYDSEDNMLITMAESYGYGYTSVNENGVGSFDFNNAEMRALVKDLKAKFDLGYFTTRNMNAGNYTNKIFTDVAAKSRMYMCIGSTGGSSYQRNDLGLFETAAAPIPYAANGTPKTISQGPSLVLFDKNEEINKYTWLFTQYLLTDYVQARFAVATGYLPVTTTATALPEYQSFLDSANSSTAVGMSAIGSKAAIQSQESSFTSPAFVGSSTARDEIGMVLVKVLSANKPSDADIKVYFDDAIDECKYQAGQA